MRFRLLASLLGRGSSFGPVALGASTALAMTAAIVVPSYEAQAKSGYDSAYGFERTWNAALRLIRVDLGFKVTEKDDAAGYVLFDYTSPESGGKVVAGSMQFIREKDDGTVQVVVQIPQMPGYHEQVLIDALARKLRAEYGDPPKLVRPAAPKDAGVDAEP